MEDSPDLLTLTLTKKESLVLVLAILYVSVQGPPNLREAVKPVGQRVKLAIQEQKTSRFRSS